MLCKFNLGVLKFKLGLITEALADYQELIKLYPKESAILYNMAICYI
jgi:tetratricopeptide (TPR) repeat protein